jgi:diguanylate cyclase (GGDEF)-like protein
MTGVADVADEQQEVAGAYLTATMAYVARACGDAGVAEVLARAGEDPARLPTEDEWLSVRRMVKVAEAAAAVTGNPDVVRLVGEELFAHHVATGIDQQIRSLGNPVRALRTVVAHGSRMAGAWTLEVTHVGDRLVGIESTSTQDQAHVFFCGIAVGYYAEIPGIFGQRGTVVHPTCLARGDRSCSYEVRWTEADEHRDGPSFDPVAHFEKLQAVGVQLAAAEGPSEVVRAAVELASRVTDGRRFLLRAEVGERRAAVVAHHGFGTDLEAEAALDRIERGQIEAADGEATICLVPLATPRAEYGWLASFHPPRSTIDRLLRRPLASFAKHVASALESAIALDAARRDRDTAHALVDFAHRLASVTSAPQVAALIASTLPAATGCASARVWLLESDGPAALTLAGPRAGGEEPPGSLANENAVLVTRSLASRIVDDAQMAALRAGAGARRDTTVVPLLARGRVLGCVAAEWEPPGNPTPDALDRLEAMVDQAALALDVAWLLDSLNHQALHDPLSGLANRALLARRAEEAMGSALASGGEVGILFVDLDRFKVVNDELGHAAGDEVICQVARRLQGVAGAADTVARLGGDEFVVLLATCRGEDHALATGEQVRAAMQAPFTAAGQQLSVSATVGVLSADPGQQAWHGLLDRADAAMYAGKQRGGGAVLALSSTSPP